MQHWLTIIAFLACRPIGQCRAEIPGTEDGGADYGNADDDNTILAALVLPQGIPLPPPLLQLQQQSALPATPPPAASSNNWNRQASYFSLVFLLQKTCDLYGDQFLPIPETI